MRYVALEGGGAVLTSLEGGHIAVGAGEASEMGEHHLAGKVRILAVMSPERLPGVLADEGPDVVAAGIASPSIPHCSLFRIRHAGSASRWIGPSQWCRLDRDKERNVRFGSNSDEPTDVRQVWFTRES